MADPLSRWRSVLGKTSQRAFGRLAAALGATEVSPAFWDDLEADLIQADLGVPTAHSVLSALQKTVERDGLRRGEDLRVALRAELQSRLSEPQIPDWHPPTKVILVVGVNGSGKTTTIAKLANYYLQRGKSVLLAAADTFRAAATEQLQVWAQRLKVDIIAGQPGSDPGAVAFSAVEAGASRGLDLVIIDTAGRLHTRSNLMEELKKVHRVTGKALAGSPHAVWLVLDATTGQNALAQAKSFKEAVGVTGVVLAKLDSSARGGMAFAIQHELGLPILFAGTGEGLYDLEEFSPAAFVNGILAQQ